MAKILNKSCTMFEEHMVMCEKYKPIYGRPMCLLCAQKVIYLYFNSVLIHIKVSL